MKSRQLVRHMTVFNDIPALLIRTEQYHADRTFELSSFSWGKLHYAAAGVIEFEINGRSMLSPPQYAIWIPPHTPHKAKTRFASEYATLQVREDLSAFMPGTPITLEIDTVLRAIIADFAARSVMVPISPSDKRMAEVLLDRLQLSQRYENYLPFSQNRLLKYPLDKMYSDPGCRKPLSHWAEMMGVSERTLARKFSEELGMSYDEWRQRCKVIQSTALLEKGMSVKDVAEEMGYCSASSFIAMFRRLTGTSPARLAR